MITDLLFLSKYVHDKVQKERLEICKGVQDKKCSVIYHNRCSAYRAMSGTCAECGCLVRLKTALKTEECPLKKWGKVDS